MAQTSQWKIVFILAIIVVFGLFLRLVFFSGIDASDGLMNTKYAYDISNNIFPTSTNQANSRIGILIPVSLLYSAFGVNDITSIIIILSTSLLGIILIYFFGKMMFNQKVGLLAALMLSFFPLDVINSTKFLSDLPSAFFVALCIFLFLKAEKVNRSLRSYYLYALSGLSLGIAFSIREMAILVILFFIFYFIYKRKLRFSYLIILISFLVILLLEMVFFYENTGNPLYRFDSLNNVYVDAVIKDKSYGRIYFPNFFLAWPYVIFDNIQLGYFYAFIFMASFYWMFNRKKETDYLMLWMFSLMLYLVFGSTSATRYVPFLAVARYLSYCTMPGILLLSAFLIGEKNRLRGFIAPFMVVFLLFTSLGAIYLDESHFGLDKLRQAYSLVMNSDIPIYTDSRSKFIFEYYSGY
ncbi:glycosyltransferase family 39 protein, partial [Candidatus Woesearchaeota archaeon]|nr:glycosyltransferase family 39 protein [Candidatus Woesearchaeota archaeon]